MAADDNEKGGSEPPPSGSTSAPPPTGAPPAPSRDRLPPKVVRALERAREAAKADSARRGGRWLAILPVLVAASILLFMMPRATEPDDVPLPRWDARVLRRVAAEDDARAAAAEARRLPGDVLAIGTAVRALHSAEAAGSDELAVVEARRQLDLAVTQLTPREGLEEDLLALRALQTRRFLDALAHYENTGETTEDLRELGGTFVRRSEESGWIVQRRVLLGDAARRAAFRAVWTAITGLDGRKAFQPSADEQAVLHAFYLAHPRPAESRREMLAAARRDAKTPEQCRRAALEERRQAELWRADKIRRIEAFDPTYPTGYALGVAYYRAGRFDLAAESFAAFTETHKDGPWALLAKNHLKASLVASGAL